MVVVGDPGADLPPDTAVGLDVDDEVAGRLVLLNCQYQERRDRHVDAVKVRRPDRDLVVVLVRRWQPGSQGDLYK